MKEALTSQQLAEIDGHIFASYWINAIKAIREFTGVPLREAIDFCFARRRELREESPERFALTEQEEAQREFYS
jgi:hypothetical protein